MNLLETLSKLEKLENKASLAPWDNRCKEFSNLDTPRHIWCEYGWLTSFVSPLESAAKDASFVVAARNSLPLLIAALREAIDLIQTMEKVFEKYPMYARLNAEKLEPIGNPCTEFLKKYGVLA